MFYCRSIIAYSLSLNTIEGHVIVRSVGNHDEIGIISSRRWSKYGIVLAANSHFSLPHKLPTPMFHKHWFFSSQISNERRLYSLPLFERLSSVSLHNCKHENFSFRGHILIIIWTADIFCVIMLIAPIFLLIFTWPAISFDRFSYCDGLYNSVLLKTFSLCIRISWPA